MDAPRIKLSELQAGLGEPPAPVRAHGVQKVSYRHEECIRYLVERPFITQRELSFIFGVTESWLSRVMSSDAFKARLAEAKLEVHGPAIATIKEKFEALASVSLDKLIEAVAGHAAAPSEKLLLESAKISATALGYGAREPGSGNGGSAQVIINLPGKAPSESAWAERYTPRGASPGEVIDAGTPKST